MLLALDTATSAVTAAVHDGRRVLAQATHTDLRRHAELLAPAIEQVLAEAGTGVADLDHVVVGIGPGPFTGLRVGVVTALVLAHVRSVPVHGLCSLDVLAQQAVTAGVVTRGGLLVATDARRREVYWARYTVRDGRAERSEGPAVARSADLGPRLTDLPCVGRGPLLYPDHLRDPEVADGVAVPRDVSAAALAEVALRGLNGAGGPELLPPEPLYLRRPDAALPGPPKTVHQPPGGAP